MKPDVTVVIPTIPPRRHCLYRALESVFNQTQHVASVSIAVDWEHEGSWVTRNRALQAAVTPWIAFLDDDDEFLPHHVESLRRCADETGADMVYSYFTTQYSGDPLMQFGLPFNYDDPAKTHPTITTLVRTELAQSVGFKAPGEGASVANDDIIFVMDLVKLGAKIVHHPDRTWHWHWGDSGCPNTSGLPDHWNG